MNNFDYKNLTPFKWFVLENFPFIENDFDAINNYHLFSKVVEYLNKTIDNMNITGEQMENVTNAMTELQNYVDNYFENLDIQEEVNQKLDEMAESGELAELISQYLESKAVIGFNTTSALSQATNLANGSIARTLGRNQYNDGYGAFYKIRQRTNVDTPDAYNIIVLTNTENLVAERIISQIEKDVEILNTDMSLIKNKKVIFIGDSYAQGYSPDGDTINWVTAMINSLGLSNSIIKVYGGVGFVNTVDNKTFITLLDEVPEDNTITDIICCGGYNDTSHINDIQNAINTFCTLAKTKFPNATVHIGQIGWTTNADKYYSLSKVTEKYNISTLANNCHYLNNVEFSLHSTTLFASDGVHPNQNGQYELARYIRGAFLNGSCNVIRSYINITKKNQNTSISAESLSNTLGCTQFNNYINVSTQSSSDIIFNSPQAFSGRNGIDIRLFDVNNSYIVGNPYNYNTAKLNVIIATSDNKYYNSSATIKFYKGEVHLLIKGIINDSHNNYSSFNISQIQVLDQFNMSCDAIMC